MPAVKFMKKYCFVTILFIVMVTLSCNQNQRVNKPGRKISTQPPNIHARPAVADTNNNMRQFVYIKNVQQQQNGQWVCTADYIEFYMGDKAVQVAKKRGDAAVDTGANGKLTYFVYNDYYIVNDNKKLHKLPVSSAVVIKLVNFNSNPIGMRNGSLNELMSMKGRDAYPFILSISKGLITSITQQYVP
jgi:hypothetical protein